MDIANNQKNAHTHSFAQVTGICFTHSSR